ncbi:hypothetical protein C6H68_15150 [Photorhabdus luminescens]|nr:hypothetical protein C6H68_15150 [Photorhabdus luminescens]
MERYDIVAISRYDLFNLAKNSIELTMMLSLFLEEIEEPSERMFVEDELGENKSNRLSPSALIQYFDKNELRYLVLCEN